MSDGKNQDRSGFMNSSLNGSAFGKARTNREMFKNNPTAYRAWVALQPGVAFDKWLDQPAKVIFPGGSSEAIEEA